MLVINLKSTAESVRHFILLLYFQVCCTILIVYTHRNLFNNKNQTTKETKTAEKLCSLILTFKNNGVDRKLNL